MDIYIFLKVILKLFGILYRMKLIKYLPLILLTSCAKATLVHLPSGDTDYEA